MLEIEEYIMIRELHAKGFSITDISDKTGFDRKTVKKYLNITTIPEPKQRAKKASLLDQYKDHIIQKLNQAPFTASRLFREIQEMGFKGKCTIVRDFVRKVRPETGVQAVYRFETKPGVQAQVDWSELGRVEIDGKNLKLYCFNMILSFSRNRFTQFTADARTEEFLRLLLEAGQYFDGFPKEILFDNLKQVVLKRSVRYEDNEWNPSFEDFSGHYDITPRLCRPGRAQTKGKVET